MSGLTQMTVQPFDIGAVLPHFSAARSLSLSFDTIAILQSTQRANPSCNNLSAMLPICTNESLIARVIVGESGGTLTILHRIRWYKLLTGWTTVAKTNWFDTPSINNFTSCCKRRDSVKNFAISANGSFPSLVPSFSLTPLSRSLSRFSLSPSRLHTGHWKQLRQ